jgi:hypothetical protein
MSSVPVFPSPTALLFLLFTAQGIDDVAFCLPGTAAWN